MLYTLTPTLKQYCIAALRSRQYRKCTVLWFAFTTLNSYYDLFGLSTLACACANSQKKTLIKIYVCMPVCMCILCITYIYIYMYVHMCIMVPLYMDVNMDVKVTVTGNVVEETDMDMNIVMHM